jgi:hypothetical protein
MQLPKLNSAAKYSSLLFLATLMLASSPAQAAVFQWSAPLNDVISPESKEHPRAFLWIPENCQKVRAIVIADQNMEEEQLFQDPDFRKILSDLGFAEI